MTGSDFFRILFLSLAFSKGVDGLNFGGRGGGGGMVLEGGGMVLESGGGMVLQGGGGMVLQGGGMVRAGDGRAVVLGGGGGITPSDDGWIFFFGAGMVEMFLTTNSAVESLGFKISNPCNFYDKTI